MPIRDMVRFVQLTRAGDATIGDRVDLLEAHRDALAERLDLLRRHFEAIENKIKIYRDLLVASPPPRRVRTKGVVMKRWNSAAPASRSASSPSAA